jgi:hypothetical protein
MTSDEDRCAEAEKRRLEIAPQLAYGDRGVPDVIPPAAVLTAEITFLEACRFPHGSFDQSSEEET